MVVGQYEPYSDPGNHLLSVECEQCCERETLTYQHILIVYIQYHTESISFDLQWYM